MEDRKLVKSYSNVWRLERRFYHFGGVKLLTPISGKMGAYAVIIMLIMSVLGKGLQIPVLWRYFIIPFSLAWILDQRLIDSKNPFQFFRSLFHFYWMNMTKGHRVRRFKRYKIVLPQVKTKIPYRVHKEKP